MYTRRSHVRFKRLQYCLLYTACCVVSTATSIVVVRSKVDKGYVMKSQVEVHRQTSDRQLDMLFTFHAVVVRHQHSLQKQSDLNTLFCLVTAFSRETAVKIYCFPQIQSVGAHGAALSPRQR